MRNGWITVRIWMHLGSILSAFHAMFGNRGRIALWNQSTAMRSASQVDNHPIQDHGPTTYWPPVYMSQRKITCSLGQVLQPKAKHPTSLNHQITQPPQTCYKIIPDRLSQSIIKCKVPYSTLPETNIAPKNGWLEYVGILLSYWGGLFSGAHCQFQGG